MRKVRPFLALVVCAALLFLSGAQAYAQAEPRGSQYIFSYLVDAYAGDSRGQVKIDCMVKGNFEVQKIGVLKIEIYKSTGSYVTTIHGTTSNGLLSPESSVLHGLTYTYTGVPGTTYYAKVTLCAGTNSDYDTRNVQTQKVTAPY